MRRRRLLTRSCKVALVAKRSLRVTGVCIVLGRLTRENGRSGPDRRGVAEYVLRMILVMHADKNR